MNPTSCIVWNRELSESSHPWDRPNDLPPAHLGQRGAGPRALGGHGEHGGDAQAHAGRCGVHVDPEGHPGQDDDEQRGDVHLDQVVAHLPLQVELHLDARELSCGGDPAFFYLLLFTLLQSSLTFLMKAFENVVIVSVCGLGSTDTE